MELGDCNQAYFESRLADAELLKELVRIAADAEGYLGNVPPQATYWVSRFPAAMIAPTGSALALLPEAEERSYAVHVALAVSDRSGPRGKANHSRTAWRGSRFDGGRSGRPNALPRRPLRPQQHINRQLIARFRVPPAVAESAARLGKSRVLPCGPWRLAGSPTLFPNRDAP